MRTLTIEDMIKQGASWKEIEARVKEIQLEEAARKAAAEKAKKEKAERLAKEQRIKRNEAISIARNKIIAAIADWLIVEGMIKAEDRDNLIHDITPTVNYLAEEIKAMFALDSIFNKR